MRKHLKPILKSSETQLLEHGLREGAQRRALEGPLVALPLEGARDGHVRTELAAALPIERPAHPHLQAWFARLCERPSYRNVVLIPIS